MSVALEGLNETVSLSDGKQSWKIIVCGVNMFSMHYNVIRDES